MHRVISTFVEGLPCPPPHARQLMPTTSCPSTHTRHLMPGPSACQLGQFCNSLLRDFVSQNTETTFWTEQFQLGSRAFYNSICSFQLKQTLACVFPAFPYSSPRVLASHHSPRAEVRIRSLLFTRHTTVLTTASYSLR